MHIWEALDWPQFRWDESSLADALAAIHHERGCLFARMQSLGLQFREESVLRTLTQDVLKSSEIEGVRHDLRQVRSSVARRLGLDAGGLPPAGRDVDGIVEMAHDTATRHDRPLTKERLFGWHACLFPAGRSGMAKIGASKWRAPATDPMQVVSGPVGRERIHYTAPPAERLDGEIANFLEWFNSPSDMNSFAKAGLAHLWFVTIHPFDDGNGRIARAVADMSLARSEQGERRFYSMSAQICIEREAYYNALERAQKGSLDVTDWLSWFLDCLTRAIRGSQKTLSSVLFKARFWSTFATEALNERQIKVINRMLDGFEGKLTSSKWAKLAKCSQDTAHRDIISLMGRGILKKNSGGGRSTSYSLADV